MNSQRASLNPQKTLLLYYGVPLLLVGLLYLPVLQLPFFLDDPVHLRGVTTVSPQHLLTHTDLGAYYVRYYRPVVNLLFKAQADLSGHPSAPFWHGVVLLTHLLNMGLVGLLLGELGLSARVRGWAMLLFGLFPFSYQAVVWVTAWFHPLVMSALLLTCWAGLRYLHQPRQWGWLVTAWLAGSLAPFIHENGLLATWWLILVLALQAPPQPKRTLALLIPISLSAVGYLAISSHITGKLDFKVLREHFLLGNLIFMGVLARPKRHYPIPVLHVKHWHIIGLGLAIIVGLLLLNLRGTPFLPKIAYFAQGMSFPLQYVSRLLPLSATQQVFFGAGLLGLVGLGVCLLPAYRHLLLWAAVWGMTASLPALLFLEGGYILSAPRLLYICAPAVALGYALLLDYLFQHSRLLALVGLGLVLIFSLSYIREKMGLYTLLGDHYQAFMGQLPANTEAEILVINAPRWLASEALTFPMDDMGAVFVPDYFPVQDFIWLNTGVDYPHLQTVTELESLAWQTRTTGLGDVLSREQVEALEVNADCVYRFDLTR